MNEDLTKKEKRLLAALSARGEMTKPEAMRFWGTPGYGREKLNRLSDMGLIKITESERIIPNMPNRELLNFLR